MPKFNPNAIIEDCWSSIGNITFFHRNGKCFWKRKPYSVFRGTQAQLDQAQVHHRAILAWQHLDHLVQLKWREYAKTVPSHRPPFDDKHHISGYNLFVSAYHGFAQLGCEHIPIPQVYPEFPSASLEFIELIHGIEVVTVKCRLTLTDIIQPERWHLSSMVQITDKGMGANPGKMRSFMATPASSVIISLSTSRISYCLSIPISRIINPCQIHLRYRLIDSITGYRNNWSNYCSLNN